MSFLPSLKRWPGGGRWGWKRLRSVFARGVVKTSTGSGAAILSALAVPPSGRALLLLLVVRVHEARHAWDTFRADNGEQWCVGRLYGKLSRDRITLMFPFRTVYEVCVSFHSESPGLQSDFTYFLCTRFSYTRIKIFSFHARKYTLSFFIL